jgi:glycosyltransferase involved in cell wall biosynthesis
VPDHPDLIAVVIAAYNEEAAIVETVTGVKAIVPTVVVVDDASADDTGKAAAGAGAHVVLHPINLGQGAALQTGIEYALSLGADYIVTFDADGQHDAAEIMGMYQALRNSGADIALGSRFLGGVRGLPRSRRLLLKAAILFTRLTSGGRFTDVHNGFRVLTRGFAERFQFRQNRMAHASEILNYIARNKISFIEHPVTIHYTDYSIGKGQRNINSLRIIMELLLGKISK